MADGWLLTGVPAAGKTTVGRLLASRLGLGFAEGDLLHPGVHGPSESRYRVVAAALPGAVVEDVVLGPWLEWLLERTGPCSVVVLAPSADTVARRNAARGKEGYHWYSVAELDYALREETARIGLWIDNSAQTPEETVAEILARAHETVVSFPL